MGHNKKKIISAVIACIIAYNINTPRMKVNIKIESCDDLPKISKELKEMIITLRDNYNDYFRDFRDLTDLTDLKVLKTNVESNLYVIKIMRTHARTYNTFIIKNSCDNLKFQKYTELTDLKFMHDELINNIISKQQSI